MKLTPIIAECIHDFLSEEKTLRNLVNAFGSPLNIIFPQKIGENITQFQKIFKKHNISGNIYYAHKANKSLALVKEIEKNKIGIDVSSEKELINALSCGFRGNRIEVTGPKNTSFLILALLHKCLIQIDNLQEIEQIIVLKEKLGILDPVLVLVRISGFIEKDSRFGIGIKDLNKLIKVLVKNKQSVLFKGLSFHLDSNVVYDKTVALEKIIEHQELFQKAGLIPRIINIGGGFKINYLKNQSEWNTFLGNTKKSIKNSTNSFFWRNNPPISYYEYFTKTSGVEYLDEILSSQYSLLPNLNLGNIINDLLLTIAIEPGRSLLNQVGITVAQVTFVKESSFGETLIGLDMNRSHLASTDQEMMIDPFIIYKSKKTKQKKQGVYFVGNLCLENDFIYKHKTFLDQLPEIGDLVVFVNTAPYNMDFTESETIQHPVAKKIAVVKKNNSFVWYEDSKYNPYTWEEHHDL